MGLTGWGSGRVCQDPGNNVLIIAHSMCVQGFSRSRCSVCLHSAVWDSCMWQGKQPGGMHAQGL